jgi:autotransporter translocation and assembly factor TamB
LTGTLRLTGKGAEPPLLAGDIVVSDGNIAQLAIGRSGAGQWAYPPAVRFAVTARVGEGLFLRNPQASVLLDGAVRVTGTLAQPRVEGEIRGRTGIVRLPASVLTLTDLSLPFAATVDPLTKTWQWTARLRVEGETQVDIHRIIFFVSGPVDEQSQRLGILPAVTLLATPPLPERTLLERLFGVSLAQLSQALTDWQQLFSGALVQSFMGDLLAPLTTPLAAALHLSEISLVREQTTGRRWLRLGLPLSPRLHILWRQGLSAGDPSAIEVQYFLDKRTSITWMKQENERAEIRIQTSVRF